MIIAVTVTFFSIGNFSGGFIFVLLFILVGGSIGAFIAYKIPKTAMPELVAGFHSLVGLAAVFVAISAFLNPEAFNRFTRKYQIRKFNRNVYWSSSRSYNFFRFNHCFLKITRNNVWFTNYI